MEKYDIIVIGGGPGGYPAAIRAAQSGAKTALIEKEALGGTCLNWGCIPTKTLLATAGLFHELQHADRMGLIIKDTSCDYAALTARKNQVVQKLGTGVAGLLKAHGVRVFNGVGQLRGAQRVAVMEDGKETLLEAGHIIIATGTIPARPAFLPEHPAVFDSRAFLDFTSLPESLLVMGGGIIGCELACLAAQLGSQVTIVEMLDDILMMLDKDVRRELRRFMERELKIRILTKSPLAKVEVGEGTSGIRATAGKENLEAAGILVAVGRTPYTDGLGLENAGIKVNDRGFIDVDENYRTRSATVFAVGDVNGGPQLAHAATAQGLAAVAAALTGKAPRGAVVPACVFTAPEIGVVGLTEQDAAEKKQAIITGKFSFAALGKALAADHTVGFVKWVADKDTGQVLGAQVIGAHATELIAEATMAVQGELTLKEVAHTVHSHPTMSEAWMEAAHAALGNCVHAPPSRR